MQLSTQKLKKGIAKVFHGIDNEPFSQRASNISTKGAKLLPNLKRSLQLDSKAKEPSLKSIPDERDQPPKGYSDQEMPAKSMRLINYRSMSESKLVDCSSDLLDYCKRIIPNLHPTKKLPRDGFVQVVPSIQSQVYCLPLIQASAPKSMKEKSRTSRSQVDILPLSQMGQQKKVLAGNSSRVIESREPSCSSVKYNIVSLSLEKTHQEKPIRKAQKQSMNPFELFPKLKVLFKDSVNLIAVRTDRGNGPRQSESLINNSRVEEGSNSIHTPSAPSILMQAS